MTTDIDFSPSEVKTVQQALAQRWRDQAVDVQLADLEAVKENQQSTQSYPALVWQASHSTFIITKTEAFTYQGFFYYGQENQRYDTGIDHFHDLYECANKLLKAQANFVLAKEADQ